MFSAWIIYKLCGELVDAAPSTVGHVPFSSKSRTWMKKKDFIRFVFDVKDSQLYPLVEAGEAFGEITQAAAAQTGLPAGLPLIATGSDKACETIGLGCITPEKAALSFGTTATLEVTTPRYMEPYPFVPPYVSVLRGHWTPEIEIYRGYWLVSWFKKEFAEKETALAKDLGVSAESLLDKRLKEIPPGCNGLLLHPYFTPGMVMPHAKGSIIGLSDNHTRLHLYRAIIEGINFALMEGLRNIERRGKLSVKRLYVAGGGSQSREICQITANMFGLPLCRIHTHEVTGIGSSMVAFVSQKVFASFDEGIRSMVHVQDTFDPDEAETQLYRSLCDHVFVNVFDKLAPFYKNIGDIL
jgi:sugar (pentulose or hexulose) kinase